MADKIKVNFKTGTQEKYDTLIPDPNTIYQIENEDGETDVYLGEIPLNFIPVEHLE